MFTVYINVGRHSGGIPPQRSRLKGAGDQWTLPETVHRYARDAWIGQACHLG